MFVLCSLERWQAIISSFLATINRSRYAKYQQYSSVPNNIIIAISTVPFLSLIVNTAVWLKQQAGWMQLFLLILYISLFCWQKWARNTDQFPPHQDPSLLFFFFEESGNSRKENWKAELLLGYLIFISPACLWSDIQFRAIHGYHWKRWEAIQMYGLGGVEK